MQLQIIAKIVGLLLTLFSFTMFFPILVAIIYREGSGGVFLSTFFILLFTGLALWLPYRHKKSTLKVKEGFLVVVLFWSVLGSAGALPFYLYGMLEMSVTDAFYESFSSLTTTGGTVITNLDYLYKDILFYRHMLQWLGGMGIIVLAVAILPILGIGGMQLYKAEASGPIKDNKITPRITETAKALWFIYLNLTIACALSFWLAGMTAFDAICHSFSTIAIGGFSTHDSSIGYFDSSLINMITVVFLLISALNFTLHFLAFGSGKFNVKHYWNSTECRAFIFIQISLFLLCFLLLLSHNVYDSTFESFEKALFQSVSFSTTAGFGVADVNSWPNAVIIVLLFSSFIGGCAGSTGGGMKVMRIVLLCLQGLREMKQLVHPSAVYPVKFGGAIIPTQVLSTVWGFFAAYILVFVVCMIGVIATGVDVLTSFAAVLASLNNLGMGVWGIASNYAQLPDTAKWLLITAMIFGRLEIFTLLVLLTPTFWRK